MKKTNMNEVNATKEDINEKDLHTSSVVDEKVPDDENDPDLVDKIVAEDCPYVMDVFNEIKKLFKNSTLEDWNIELSINLTEEAVELEILVGKTSDNTPEFYNKDVINYLVTESYKAVTGYSTNNNWRFTVGTGNSGMMINILFFEDSIEYIDYL